MAVETINQLPQISLEPSGVVPTRFPAHGNDPIIRNIPKAGEIWRHVSGRECFVLGILVSDQKSLSFEIVAYEMHINHFNQATSVLESADIVPREKYWRTLASFMERCTKVESEMDQHTWANYCSNPGRHSIWNLPKSPCN